MMTMLTCFCFCDAVAAIGALFYIVDYYLPWRVCLCLFRFQRQSRVVRASFPSNRAVIVLPTLSQVNEANK